MNTNHDPATTPAPGTAHPAAPLAEGVPAVEHRPARDFFHSLRDDKPRWWKPVLVAVLLVVVYLIANIVFSIAAVVIESVRGNMTFEDMTDPTSMQMTPLIFGSALLSLAVLWPASLGIHKIFYPNRPVGALFSVLNRFRWRWAARAALLALVVQGVYYVVAMLFFAEGLGLTTEVVANPWPWFIMVVLLMPVQAAAEEIAFRGLLGRSIGALFARAGVAVAVALTLTSIAFGQAHAASDPWLIVYYTGFGVLMGVVTWKTGGIEAAVVLHVVNNLLSGGLGAFFSDLSGGIDRSMGAGSPAILVHLAVLAAIGAVLIWLARRHGLDIETTPEVPAVPTPVVADPWTPTPHRRTVARDDAPRPVATQPTDPTQSTDPAQSTDPTQPTDPAQSTPQSVDPVER